MFSNSHNLNEIFFFHSILINFLYMDLHFLDMILYDSDSDDELEIVTIASMEAESSSKSRHAARKRREFVWRNPLQGHQRLFLDYFVDPPVYPPKLFRRRFRMNRSLFLRIHSTL